MVGRVEGRKAFFMALFTVLFSAPDSRGLFILNAVPMHIWLFSMRIALIRIESRSHCNIAWLAVTAQNGSIGCGCHMSRFSTQVFQNGGNCNSLLGLPLGALCQ